MTARDVNRSITTNGTSRTVPLARLIRNHTATAAKYVTVPGMAIGSYKRSTFSGLGMFFIKIILTLI